MESQASPDAARPFGIRIGDDAGRVVTYRQPVRIEVQRAAWLPCADARQIHTLDGCVRSIRTEPAPHEAEVAQFADLSTHLCHALRGDRVGIEDHEVGAAQVQYAALVLAP